MSNYYRGACLSTVTADSCGQHRQLRPAPGRSPPGPPPRHHRGAPVLLLLPLARQGMGFIRELSWGHGPFCPPRPGSAPRARVHHENPFISRIAVRACERRVRVGASLRIAETASAASVTKGAARNPDAHRRKSRPASDWLTAFLANEPDIKIVAGLIDRSFAVPTACHH